VHTVQPPAAAGDMPGLAAAATALRVPAESYACWDSCCCRTQQDTLQAPWLKVGELLTVWEEGREGGREGWRDC
jgi:hypothetical protein